MAIADALLPELDHEAAATRKCLERVPDDKLDWSPHAKSGSFRWLLSHLVEIPGWVSITVETDSLDFAPPGQPPYQTTQQDSVAAALTAFDANVAAARATIAGADDGLLLRPWTLLVGGHEVMTLPKVACLRSFVMNHLIHHRAQLGVYLRLNDVPVPAIYGPSADEQGM